MFAQRIPFAKFLKSNKRPYELGPTEDADLVGMRLYGLGPFHRERKPAVRIAKKSHFVIRDGDIIYNKLFAWKGTFGVVPARLDGMFVSDKFPTYELDETKVNRDFLRWYFRCPVLWEEARQMSTGSAALSKLTLNPPRFLELTIPDVPLTEQIGIARKLETLAAKIEEARNIRQHAVEGDKTILGAQLGQLFGDPYEGRQGKLGFDAFRLLGEVVTDVADGPHVTPTYTDDGVPFITVLNITSGTLDFSGAKCISSHDHRTFQKRARAERGDVLLSKDGTIGIPCYVAVDREFSFFVSVALIKPQRGVLDGKYLQWVLRSPYVQKRIRERSRGDMIRHFVLREIRNLTIPVPPLSDQHRAVTYLEDFKAKTDAIKQLHTETASKLDALLPSIIDKAFRGEL